MKVLIYAPTILTYRYLFLVEYRMSKPGTLCSDQDLDEVTSAAQCKDAGEQLELKWIRATNHLNDFPACFHDGRNEVYFNTNPIAVRTKLAWTYAAICIIPYGKIYNIK